MSVQLNEMILVFQCKLQPSSLISSGGVGERLPVTVSWETVENNYIVISFDISAVGCFFLQSQSLSWSTRIFIECCLELKTNMATNFNLRARAAAAPWHPSCLPDRCYCLEAKKSNLLMNQFVNCCSFQLNALDCIRRGANFSYQILVQCCMSFRDLGLLQPT